MSYDILSLIGSRSVQFMAVVFDKMTLNIGNQSADSDENEVMEDPLTIINQDLKFGASCPTSRATANWNFIYKVEVWHERARLERLIPDGARP